MYYYYYYYYYYYINTRTGEMFSPPAVIYNTLTTSTAWPQLPDNSSTIEQTVLTEHLSTELHVGESTGV